MCSSKGHDKFDPHSFPSLPVLDEDGGLALRVRAVGSNSPRYQEECASTALKRFVRRLFLWIGCDRVWREGRT